MTATEKTLLCACAALAISAFGGTALVLLCAIVEPQYAPLPIGPPVPKEAGTP